MAKISGHVSPLCCTESRLNSVKLDGESGFLILYSEFCVSCVLLAVVSNSHFIGHIHNRTLYNMQENVSLLLYFLLLFACQWPKNSIFILLFYRIFFSSTKLVIGSMYTLFISILVFEFLRFGLKPVHFKWPAKQNNNHNSTTIKYIFLIIFSCDFYCNRIKHPRGFAVLSRWQCTCMYKYWLFFG